jgi:hypothetical protein
MLWGDIICMAPVLPPGGTGVFYLTASYKHYKQLADSAPCAKECANDEYKNNRADQCWHNVDITGFGTPITEQSSSEPCSNNTGNNVTDDSARNVTPNNKTGKPTDNSANDQIP